MEIFKDTNVPFNPGYDSIYLPILADYDAINQEYAKLKANHQKKFFLIKYEPQMVDLIEKNAAFYLGCILWGGFISCKFKGENKELSGNTTANLSEQEIETLDCSSEARTSLAFIKSFDRNCMYILKRPFKISQKIGEIYENYIEFANLNENFVNTKTTNDVKLPKSIEHFKALGEETLDALYERIQSAIKNSSAKELLEIGFYKD